MTDLTADTMPTRRSRFLAGVTLFAGIWLLGFLVDAGLSTLDDLLRAVGIGSLTHWRNGVAIGVLLLALPMILALVFVPHLPKRIYLAPVLFVVWANLVQWPVMQSADAPLTGLAVDLMQLALAVFALRLVKRRTGRLWLRAADLPVKTHLLRRILISGGVFALVMLLALPAAGLALFAATVERQTGGYLRFTVKGVEAQEAVLTKGGSTVRLVGMIHIGEGRFYRDLFASFQPQALVLAEGVTDREGLLKAHFSYGRLAAALGLEEQSEIQAEWMKAVPHPAPSGGDASVPATVRPGILRADIDISDFTPVTIRFLGEVGEVLASETVWEAFRRLSDMDGRYTDKDVETVYADLIDRRNAKLLEVFDRETPAHLAIVIPWGAQHMPGIEKALRDRGYAVQSRKALNVATYGEIF